MIASIAYPLASTEQHIQRKERPPLRLAQKTEIVFNLIHGRSVLLGKDSTRMHPVRDTAEARTVDQENDFTLKCKFSHLVSRHLTKFRGRDNHTCFCAFARTESRA